VKRCAIYTRMSTDKQSADSLADGVTQCPRVFAARGWTVVESLVRP
jgi:DNA invertase Pin-like site-specific DNA recombinase